MKCCLFFVGLIMALMPVTHAYSTPQFDSKAWEQFFNGKTAIIPDGYPTGPGAVGVSVNTDTRAKSLRINEKIDRPLDLSKLAGTVYSKQAIETQSYYGSQAMSDFLTAATREFHKLSPSKLDIPILHLGWKPSKYPIPVAMNRSNQYGLYLGIFEKTNNKTHSNPDGNTYNNKPIDFINRTEYKTYLEYVHQTERQDSKLSSYNDIEKYKLLQEIYRSAQNKVSYESKLAIEERMNGIKNANNSNSQIDKERAAKNKEDNKKKQEQKKAQYAQRDEELKRIKAQNLPSEQEIEQINALYDKWADEDFDKAAADLENRKSKASMAYNENIDIAATWAFVEAALTQTEVPVKSLSLPAGLIEALAGYAANSNRPQKVINQFKTKADESSRGFMIELGCTIRDRFLGCNNYVTDNDPQTTEMAKKLLDNVNNESDDKKLLVLELIHNAHVINIDDELSHFEDVSNRKISSLAKQIGKEQEIRDKKAEILLESKQKRAARKPKKKNK